MRDKRKRDKKTTNLENEGGPKNTQVSTRKEEKGREWGVGQRDSRIVQKLI